MTEETFLKATGAMANALRNLGAIPVRNQEPGTDEEVRNHLLYMCEMADTFYQEGRREKAMRWLGFVQGFFWGTDLMSISDLREVNRPSPLDISEDRASDVKAKIATISGIHLTEDQFTKLCHDPEARIRFELGDYEGFGDALLDALTSQLLGQPWPKDKAWYRHHQRRFHANLQKAATAKGYTYVGPK